MVSILVRQATVRSWTSVNNHKLFASFTRQYKTGPSILGVNGQQNQRCFHDYFLTHLPSCSLYPDCRAPATSYQNLHGCASTPHTGSVHPPTSISRETVVRIPLRSAKDHFGVSTSRGSRPSNEDTYQAGVICLPAFAKRAPLSLTIQQSGDSPNSLYASSTECRSADATRGDPQVFYFGVFDGHGGAECSEFLRNRLHEYIQGAAESFELQSSLKLRPRYERREQAREPLVDQEGSRRRIGKLERSLLEDWKNVVGGYFRRFRPAQFSFYTNSPAGNHPGGSSSEASEKGLVNGARIGEVMEYAFLRADLDFVKAQASRREDDDPVQADQPLNRHDILHSPSRTHNPKIGGRKMFQGGSTGSVAMISTPTPTPFWHPATPSSLLVSHVGDTRVILCCTATGAAIPLTTNHHPSSPIEASRLRRYAAMFVTDSFGEERMGGLANTRAFGDIRSKRLGVSAEPEMRRVEMGAAQYSFLVLVSDGISGSIPDQEIVDIIKEARTPDQGAQDVVSFATDVSTDADNATCLVVRLGGWERRLEGGLGSMGTKESRDWRRQEATDPRRART